MDAGSELVHATAIAFGRQAVLIRGAPGSGKSDLALRSIFLPSFPDLRAAPLAPARLVADDQVALRRHGGLILASPPKAIAGMIEVRGVGIIHLDHIAEAEVALVVDLVDPAEVERLPDTPTTVDLLGVARPRLALAPFEASAALKLALALTGAKS